MFPPRDHGEKRMELTDDASISNNCEDKADGDSLAVHKAALVFRHAIQEMGLSSRMGTPSLEIATYEPECDEELSITEEELNEEEHSELPEDDDEQSVLYLAFIQNHSMMKLTNLRLAGLDNSEMKSPQCTQTWARRLSLAVGNADAGSLRETCLKSAESWCDRPGCEEARCGPRGCLRSYRFLPRDYGISVPGGILGRECSEREYDFVSFVKCSWCSVSFCNAHMHAHYQKIKHHDGQPKRRMWYKCDECQLSSCPDCVGQIFHTPPNMEGCNVESAGKICKRMVCSKCIWYVGKEKRSTESNIPGGDYSQYGQSDVVTVNGGDAMDSNKAIQWDEVETSCSKCLRHVEFRWNELARVQESFGGFMP